MKVPSLKTLLSFRYHGTFSEGYSNYVIDRIERDGRVCYTSMTPRLRVRVFSLRWGRGND